MLAFLAMLFARRPSPRLNRGRIATSASPGSGGGGGGGGGPTTGIIQTQNTVTGVIQVQLTVTGNIQIS